MGGFVVNWKLLWGGTPGVCTLQWNSWFWSNPSQNCVADIYILEADPGETRSDVPR